MRALRNSRYLSILKERETMLKLKQVKARCTSCQKVYVPSQKEMDEAKSFGCLMSPCCMAPATVEQVSAG